MNEKFFESKEFYLVDVFNGNIRKSKINFNVISNSRYNLVNTKEVAIESKSKEIDPITGQEYYSESIYEAFMKSSLDKRKDDLDIINSEIADLLDIFASKVYRVETNTENTGIVNISVKDKQEQQINVDLLVNRLIKLIKSKNINITEWLKDYFTLPKTDVNFLLNSEKDIISVIEMSVNTISLLFNLGMEEQEILRQDFIRMIFFDLITNNSDRGFNTYSILVSFSMKFKRLAPIYDYNNEVDSKSYYRLNNVYIDKSAILSTLYHKYYPYIKKISKGLSDNTGIYLESISLIVDNNIDQLEASKIKNNFKNNIETIKSLENIHSKNIFESKLDLAMTQTSINLNALNKSQIVHSKYRTINKNNAVKVDSQEEVKIKVEEIKKTSNLSNIFLVIFSLILVAGIIYAVYYIVQNIIN